MLTSSFEICPSLMPGSTTKPKCNRACYPLNPQALGQPDNPLAYTDKQGEPIRGFMRSLSSTEFCSKSPLLYFAQMPLELCSWVTSVAAPSPGRWGSGSSPVTAIRITFSQRCFSSSLSAAKLWTDLD